MTSGDWPALDRLIARLRTVPARTGSVISTIYGDAVLPRGGALALSDLLSLMARLGATQGVVRTAISRLARDGVLRGRRTGRRSAYALTAGAEAEFRAAIPLIYGSGGVAWDGCLRLAFPTDAGQRAVLEEAGFQPLAPGVMTSSRRAPSSVLSVDASGPATALRELASRAWPLARLNEQYAEFLEAVTDLDPPGSVTPLDALAARILLIHAWRRIALRDPRLPDALLPETWCGRRARKRCVQLYEALAAPSETWLDEASSGDGLLPSLVYNEEGRGFAPDPIEGSPLKSGS